MHFDQCAKTFIEFMKHPVLGHGKSQKTLVVLEINIFSDLQEMFAFHKN